MSMLYVSIKRKNGFLVGFKIQGHAGFNNKGPDIVCAGISSLVQSAFLGLNNYLHLKLECEMRMGFFELILKDTPTKESEAILNTMLLGINEIAEMYPLNVCIKNK